MFKPSKIAILLFSGVALTLIFICPQSRNYFFELVGLFQSLDIDKIKEIQARLAERNPEKL